jgi:hypothetical protein
MTARVAVSARRERERERKAVLGEPAVRRRKRRNEETGRP